MNKKRFISGILIIALLLAGCGKANKQPDETPPEETAGPGTQSAPVTENHPAAAPAATAAPASAPAETPEPDTEPPVIHVNPYRYFYVGEPISYYSVIWVEDNVDSEDDITLSVDKSKVNTKYKGEYPVTYTATDSAGNSATVSTTINLSIETVDPDDVSAAADRILENIIDGEMTDEQKLFAVYDYIYNGINYTGGSRNYDKNYEIYRGLVSGQGNCFTFYACVEYLLQKLGFEVMGMKREVGESRHFWCIVNFGGGWYHIDACNGSTLGNHAFLKTSEELYEIDDSYWNYNPELYPQISPEPYVIQDKNIIEKLAESNE